MKVAIIGTRGIPARYGGFETLAEELAVRLSSDHGVSVTVYCRNAYYDDRPPSWKGVNLIFLPSTRLKGLESLVHTALSLIHALTKRFDLLFVVDPANAPLCVISTFLGVPVVLHTDGLGWMRRKWGRLARCYYRWVERVASGCVETLVTDNPVMAQYYLDTYGKKTECISYGSENSSGEDKRVLEKFHLRPEAYLLVVARLEPENNTDFIIKGYVMSEVALPLVIVGDAQYNPSYMDSLREAARGSKVIFAGRIDDQAELNALYRHTYLYIHGHEVGGTNPSLVRAMGSGAAPAVLHNPFNEAVIGEAGFVFQKSEGTLARMLQELAGNPFRVRTTGRMARERAEKEFAWEKITAQYCRLFQKVAQKEQTP